MTRSSIIAITKLCIILCLSNFPVPSNAALHDKLLLLNNAANSRKWQTTSSVYPVLGVRGLGIDTTSPRLEIRELERNKDQFNIYLLGLQRFQSIAQEDQLSYYQVAGIHGRPYRAWDGVEVPPGWWRGYCAHGSNLFPTWHRPYLALVEELIYLHACDVVSEFPEGDAKRRMIDALQFLRIPYWDAAVLPPANSSSYPGIVQVKTVEVEIPDGNATKRTVIPNPLYTYTFHPLSVDDFGNVQPWTFWKTTKRWPTNKTENAESRDNLVAFNLGKNADNTRLRTYHLLSTQADYLTISNHMARSGNMSGNVISDSLESIHDTLHSTVGYEGHMSFIDYAAFDPIFWLLHANTDRMLAIWQTLNPESYVSSHTNPDATFTTPPSSTADENTPLHPFHCNETGGFWTSASVRDHTVFGYTYPELIGLTTNDTLIRRVNNLYGVNATSQFSWELERASPAAPSAYPNISLVEPLATTDAFTQQDGAVQYQYYANIRAQKNMTYGAPKIYVFLDAESEISAASTDALSLVSEPGVVGYTGFQNAGSRGGGVVPSSNEGMNGVVALTKALEDRVSTGQLQSLDEVAVGAYLKEHMKWKITIDDGVFLALERAVGFEIEVSWAKVKPATLTTFPEVLDGGFKRLMQVMGGRAGDG